MNRSFVTLLLVLLLLVGCRSHTDAIPSHQKPWCFWWWMGSSVSKPDITANLENMANAGFGGVHIVPIYGEKGDEANYIDHLSPQWMEMLVHVANETRRLGMGVDMTTGTGWPFGGPHIDSTYAAKRMDIDLISRRSLSLAALRDSLVRPGVEGCTLYDSRNAPLFSGNDYAQISDALFAQTHEIAILRSSLTGQKVKRAAPGGEGAVLDPFTKSGMKHYMKRYQEAFAATPFVDATVRSFYNDSYEVYGANWTPRLLEEFRHRRGYDLMPYLRYLKDTTRCDLRQRVLTDYCETISDLLLYEFITPWAAACHAMGQLTRNQAHGSPGNLLDLYGAVDIPETESFGSSGMRIPGLRHDADYNENSFGRPHPLTLKFASSAAHTKGKPLTAAESCTWLADHFKTTLAQVKPQVDELFVSGINHVIYHGVPYSPPAKEFPGRLFYASVNFGPTTYFWEQMPLLNDYITTCQAILQNSTPRNDVLLYFAVYDVWKDLNERTFIRLFDVHKPQAWLQAKPTGQLASRLWESGVAFDYISDRGLISDLTFDGSRYCTSTAEYKTIVVPACDIIPVATLQQLLAYAKQGGSVLFERAIPWQANGLFNHEQREQEIHRLTRELLAQPTVGVVPSIVEALASVGVRRETMADLGLSYIRKQQGDSLVYFIANLSNRFTEGWIEPASDLRHAQIFNPQHHRRGAAKRDGNKLYLQLAPGESTFVIGTPTRLTSTPYRYQPPVGDSLDISTRWTLTPLHGEPALPETIKMEELTSWTHLSDAHRYFSGTIRYAKTVSLTPEMLRADGVVLEIASLHELASVRINGKPIGTIWCIPSSICIPTASLTSETLIEIDVTNCSFNRVIDLDRRGVEWKNFHEINFVNIRYEPFNAADKEPVDSGMIGRVMLKFLKRES